jgi:hypothetical protein
VLGERAQLASLSITTRRSNSRSSRSRIGKSGVSRTLGVRSTMIPLAGWMTPGRAESHDAGAVVEVELPRGRGDRGEQRCLAVAGHGWHAREALDAPAGGDAGGLELGAAEIECDQARVRHDGHASGRRQGAATGCQPELFGLESRAMARPGAPS